MTRINIGMLDRIYEEKGGVQRRLVSKSDAGFVTARIGDGATEMHETFSHTQVRELIATNLIRIDRGWFEEGRARARLIAGVSDLTHLSVVEANQMLRQQYYIDEFLKLEKRDKKVKRTDASITKALHSIDAERPIKAQRWDQSFEGHRRPSARSFRRWLRVYEENGFDVLCLRKRYRNCGSTASTVHPEAGRILNRHVMAYCDERRKPMSKIYGEMKAEFELVNMERASSGQELLTCPARSTLSNRIHALNQFEVYASRYGLAKARAKFAIVGSGLDVVRPLQHVQIDEWNVQLHTIADQIGVGHFFTEKARIALKKERMRLSVMIDVATRCILGMWLSTTANARSAISTLAMAVSDKTAIAKAYGCKSDWPMGGPFLVISPDAGSAYIDENFRACVANLKAVYENAPASLSMMRGHIERVFGTMHTSLMPNFPGRSFSNVVDLGEYAAEERAAIFTKMLPNVFVRWAVDWYHHTPHSGLGGETPYCAWERLTAKYGIDAPPNAHQRREIFGIDLDRSLDQRGIRVLGAYYQSEQLQEWRRQVGDTVVRVRYDTSNIGYISVWINENWLTVPSVLEMHRGLDLETWLESVRDLKRRYAASAKIYEHIAMAAIRAISAMADDAMRRVSIDATRPTSEQLNHEESNLLLGFEIADDISSTDPSPKSNLLDGGLLVASATTETDASQPAQPQPPEPSSKEYYGLED